MQGRYFKGLAPVLTDLHRLLSHPLGQSTKGYWLRYQYETGGLFTETALLLYSSRALNVADIYIYIYTNVHNHGHYRQT